MVQVIMNLPPKAVRLSASHLADKNDHFLNNLDMPQVSSVISFGPTRLRESGARGNSARFARSTFEAHSRPGRS